MHGGTEHGGCQLRRFRSNYSALPVVVSDARVDSATSGRFCCILSLSASKARSVQAETIVLVIVGITTNRTITQTIARAPPRATSRRSSASTSSCRNAGGNSPTKVPQQPIISAIRPLLVKKSTDDIHHRQAAQPMTPTSSHKMPQCLAMEPGRQERGGRHRE